MRGKPCRWSSLTIPTLTLTPPPLPLPSSPVYHSELSAVQRKSIMLGIASLRHYTCPPFPSPPSFPSLPSVIPSAQGHAHGELRAHPSPGIPPRPFEICAPSRRPSPGHPACPPSPALPTGFTATLLRVFTEGQLTPLPSRFQNWTFPAVRAYIHSPSRCVHSWSSTAWTSPSCWTTLWRSENTTRGAGRWRRRRGRRGRRRWLQRESGGPHVPDEGKPLS